MPNQFPSDLPAGESINDYTFVKFKRLSTDDLLEKILGRKPSVCPDCGCPLIHNCLHPPLLHI